MATVRHNASRNASDDSTLAQLLCVPTPVTDSRHTRISG